MYSSTSTITLECIHDYFHDYFNEYPVSIVKVAFMKFVGDIVYVALSLPIVHTDYCHPGVIIINN